MGRKIVVLLGHPGVGKGTQARAIVNHIGIPQISTGDMLREAIANKTTYGCEAKEKMDAGELVSDEIVCLIVEERLRQVFGVKVRLPNDTGKLRAGMAADVFFPDVPEK